MSEKTKKRQTYFQPQRPSKIKYRLRNIDYVKPFTNRTLRKFYTFPLEITPPKRSNPSKMTST